MANPLDGIWRPEEHPKKEDCWLVVRYTADLGKPLRDVHRAAPDHRPTLFLDERRAQQVCDRLNEARPQPPAPPPLSASERGWLARVGAAPEGIMERSNLRQLLALEARGLIVGKREPGRSKMDRWFVTPAGREELGECG